MSDTIINNNEPHLERKLGKFNMVAMTFAILNTWIALAGIMGLVLPSGGPVAFLYGFVFCVLCNLCLALSLGEMASVWPTAGGQYHYSYMLSTERWRNFASFSIGWLSIFGWLTLVTAAGFFAAFFVNAAIIVASNGVYDSQPWKVYLLFVAILLYSTIFNLYGNRFLDRYNNAAMFWSLLSLVVIGTTLLATSGKTNGTYVFTGFENKSGWGSGVACVLGMMQPALALIGSDAATHMSEEMPYPGRDTPRAMVLSIVMGGITGLGFLLIILFCLVDVDDVLGTATGMPIIEMVHRSTGSKAAATVISLALAICFINGTAGGVTTFSRLLYAMARDGGVPGSKFFYKLDPRFHVPSRTILACLLFNILFGLLYLGPSVAFNAYISCTTIFLNLSYAGPIVILLIRGRSILDQEVVAFSLGRSGPIWNCIAVLFVTVNTVFLCFPPGLPVNSNNMNYVTAVIGIFIVFMTTTWFLVRRHYHGPDIVLLTSFQSHTTNNCLTLSQTAGSYKKS